MTWAKGVCIGMTARQVRGLQKANALINVCLRDGERLVAIRVVPGKSEDYAAFVGPQGRSGDFALDDVTTWTMW